MKENTDFYAECIGNIATAAEKAAALQLSLFRSHALKMTTKQNAYDVVTEADKGSEKIITDFLNEVYPTHSILSEESGASGDEAAEFRWVIDPLDGTTNYSQGLPTFCISIALQHKGETVGALVYAPYLREMYTAVKGRGAFVNGTTPLRCAGHKPLEQMVMATGMPYDKKENPDNNLKYINRLAPKVRGLRRLGSAALDLCYVAAGYFDAYWELNLNAWDVEAGLLLVREAGGETTLLSDHRGMSVGAGSKSGLANLLEELRD